MENSQKSGVAAVLSFFIPGLGHIYRGQVMEGIVWLIFVVVLYAVFFPLGIIAHICAIARANDPMCGPGAKKRETPNP